MYIAYWTESPDDPAFEPGICVKTVMYITELKLYLLPQSKYSQLFYMVTSYVSNVKKVANILTDLLVLKSFEIVVINETEKKLCVTYFT